MDYARLTPANRGDNTMIVARNFFAYKSKDVVTAFSVFEPVDGLPMDGIGAKQAGTGLISLCFQYFNTVWDGCSRSMV